MTVLLLEDQGMIAIDLVDALEQQGHKVAAFASVREAEYWLNDHQPTAAIVDCVLNDGDCSHLVRQLRQDGIPIIVYTGSHASDLSEDFQDLDIFTKPAPTGELVGAIQRKLEITIR